MYRNDKWKSEMGARAFGSHIFLLRPFRLMSSCVEKRWLQRKELCYENDLDTHVSAGQATSHPLRSLPSASPLRHEGASISTYGYP